MTSQPFGYAAMLEHVHATEADAVAARAEQHGFSRTTVADVLQVDRSSADIDDQEHVLEVFGRHVLPKVTR